MTAIDCLPPSLSYPDGSLCPHFGECGGCHSQDIPYPEQLAQKARHLGELFGEFWPAAIEVAPSPRIWHYRNKVELNFDRRMYEERPPRGFERETVLGFKRRGKWFWTLDIDECRIGPAGLEAMLTSLRHWQRDHGLRARFQQTGEGSLRYVVVRETARGGERMAILITTGEPVPEASFVEAVQRAWPATSIHLGIHRTEADAAIAQEMRCLQGAETIAEELHLPTGDGPRVVRFRLSPMAFFQTNSLGTEVLYGRLRQWIERIRPALLYDLYGGAGGIALSCADLVPRIVSVENVPEATRDGYANSALNGVSHVEFVTEDVRRYVTALREGSGTLGPGAAAIVDPPRSGLHPKALTHLVKLAPAHLLYVSCNPKMLAQEMPTLLMAYRLRELQAVDLFPHTPHVETIAWLERRDSLESA